MHTESTFERRGNNRPRPPFRRRPNNRHPGLAEHEAPKQIPKPKGEIPACFAETVFGKIHPLLQHAVAEQDYLAPTPIQEKAIPHLLEGRDLLGCAQTGTGKTAAFLLPILHRLAMNPKPTVRNKPRALILAPTRELAAQIATSTTTYGRYMGLPFAVVFGGVSQYPQVNALDRGAVLVVATPGRLLDLMEQGHVTLENVEEFVLDEADRMLDMGFLPDIKRILAQLPEERHSQFFSATLSPEVMKLAMSMVKNPAHVTISPDQPTVDKINQKIMFVDKPNKDSLLIHLLQNRPELKKVLVFARTRHGSDRIEKKLLHVGIRAEAIHSDKTQRARTDALSAFRADRLRVLVATDIASRGIDVDGITHVINFDLPEETESYVHRIGRTARAGADGAAISFVSAEERNLLRAIERMIRKPIEIETGHEFHSERAEKAAGKGVPDHLPRPSWAPNKDRRPGSGHPANAGRPQHRGNQGRNQADFRREPADRGDRPAAPARPPRAPDANRAPVQERAPDAGLSPRLDDVRPDRPKRAIHHPGDKPRSAKPGVGAGHPREGGGSKGGAPKPRSSRPPWMV
jgi:ATP-dependent RNA helicase RhlE